MKRSGIKRGTSQLRRTPLRGGKVALRRTRLNRVGKRVAREKDARKAFSDYFKDCWCELCLLDGKTTNAVGHHLCSKAQGVGHPNLHHLDNGFALCFKHHDEAHRGLHPHLIKSRDFLDNL